MTTTPPEVGQRVRVPSLNADVTATVTQVHYTQPVMVGLRFDEPVLVNGTPRTLKDEYWHKCELAP
jgi:hypothetical protein